MKPQLTTYGWQIMGEPSGDLSCKGRKGRPGRRAEANIWCEAIEGEPSEAHETLKGFGMYGWATRTVRCGNGYKRDSLSGETAQAGRKGKTFDPGSGSENECWLETRGMTKQGYFLGPSW